MKTIISRIAMLCVLLPLGAHADDHAGQALNDRATILAAIECFTKWDLEGGTEESVAPCLSKDVVYQRVNQNGELIRYTPGFAYDGKGKNDYVPYITELEIFGNMAIVKVHKHRTPPNNAYMKAFVLYDLAEGWRITNVVWGGITPGA